jgi:hypothetical protein
LQGHANHREISKQHLLERTLQWIFIIISPAPCVGAEMPFKQRHKDPPRRTRQQWMAQRRFGELMRIMHRYYPNGLPHNGAGYKFAKYVCRTLAFDPIDRRAEWLDRNARWLDGTAERSRLLSYGPIWYGRWSLGDNLELHDIDRMELDVRTIEAFDVTPEQRAADNNKKNRERGDKNRRAAGVQTRDEYLATCKSHTKPWLAAGFKCRRTWERHQKKAQEGECRNSNTPPYSSIITTYVSCDTAENQANNVVPFQPRQSQATSQPVAGTDNIISGGNMLAWKPMISGNGICADTGGYGRYVIKTGDFIVLKHNGEEMKRFDSRDEAMAYAQGAYESLLRADDDYQMMPDMAEAA